jgi:hypothetical protein
VAHLPSKYTALSLSPSTAKINKLIINKNEAGHWLLIPVILATQEAEITRSWFEATPGKPCVRPYPEKNLSQKRAGGVAQGIGPEFKPW